MTDPSPIGSSGVPFQDVLLALFKHKWKIIFCTILGLAGAAAVFFWYVPIYKSEAKLLVRYVVESTPIDPLDRASNNQTQTMESIINSEVVILTSWDLAVEVAKFEKLVERRLAATETEAARRIRTGLTVSPIHGTNAIVVSYEDRDPALAPAILGTLVKEYFTKHLQVHRASNAELAGNEREKVNTALKNTETSLDAIKAAAGIISLNEGATNLIDELGKTQEQLRTAEAELEDQKARVIVLGGVVPAAPPTPTTTPKEATGDPTSQAVSDPATKAAGPGVRTALKSGTSSPAPTPQQLTPPDASNADLEEYRMLMSQLATLHQNEVAMLSKYQPRNSAVRTIQRQIKTLEGKRDALIRKFPDLIARAPAISPNTDRFDLPSEQARLVGLQARIGRLNAQLNDVRARFNKFGLNASEIARLEREKMAKEDAFKYVTSRVERARIDDALSSSNMPNISPVQEPSPAARVTSERDKWVAGLAGGGLGLGLALALLLELVMNRTIKRPLEIESRLHLPLMLAIPWMSRNGRHRLKTGKSGNARRTRGGASARAVVAPWDHSHFIRPYSEVVRDRLTMFFELNGLEHKPKLIGVAGFSEGAGASTLAGGLAAALSETGDGKVLLVDMNIGQGEAHSFFKGKPAYSLDTAIQSSNGLDSAAENLYLATIHQENGAPMPLGLRKFHAIMPGLKASDYDYIIFDLPPLSQMSPTMTMAGHMDKMLLVVEAEKNDRDVVKRRHSELVSTRAKISVIFNKARHYGPRWLEAEA